MHLDVKKLGRISQGGGHRALGRGPGRCVKGAGWEFVHVAIDDHSRLAYAEICPDEQAQTTVAFVGRALEFFEGAGIEVRRILTDNGSNYRSHLFCNHLLDRGIKVIKTRPYHPQTNGKAEAFVKIVTNEWAYAVAYRSNAERAEDLRPVPEVLQSGAPTRRHRRQHTDITGQLTTTSMGTTASASAVRLRYGHQIVVWRT